MHSRPDTHVPNLSVGSFNDKVEPCFSMASILNAAAMHLLLYQIIFFVIDTFEAVSCLSCNM